MEQVWMYFWIIAGCVIGPLLRNWVGWLQSDATVFNQRLFWSMTIPAVIASLGLVVGLASQVSTETTMGVFLMALIGGFSGAGISSLQSKTGLMMK